MDPQTTVKKRSFDLRRISEEEGQVLCELVNLNDEKIRESLADNDLRLYEILTLDEAVVIGCELRNKIMAMVDGTE